MKLLAGPITIDKIIMAYKNPINDVMYDVAAYDDNGALIYGANRGITKIEYDLRNNPHLIQFSDGSQTEYVYSALGEKLKTIHRTAVPDYKELDGDKGELADNSLSSDAFRSLFVHAPANNPVAVDTFKQGDISMLTSLSIDSTEHIGSFIFENGHADKYLFPGGYYSYAAGHPSRTGGDGSGYYYYLTDHLGNNRMVVNDNGDIEQTTHYYPFGAVYADAGKNPDFQKFKYTGKELDLTHGLNTYDHGARQNYSILGVRDKMDPMAEKYYNFSPYSICNNNPLSIYDPDGKDSYYTLNGDYTFTNMSKTDNIYIISDYKFIKEENNISYYYVYNKQRLDETKEFLSANAYSKIFTNILERYSVLNGNHKIYIYCH